jgi:hypothetical protein
MNDLLMQKDDSDIHKAQIRRCLILFMLLQVVLTNSTYARKATLWPLRISYRQSFTP